jgi:hypothetical protein
MFEISCPHLEDNVTPSNHDLVPGLSSMQCSNITICPFSSMASSVGAKTVNFGPLISSSIDVQQSDSIEKKPELVQLGVLGKLLVIKSNSEHIF